ncbi:MAG: DUF3073 domain-containing protein [Propionibacteriaceae bacterium]|nr:DUF3073 domain-containing protein [Propionibacteriaceae bacterium]
MGRGRAKAKQTKVARDLKYRTVDTDFNSLERELRSGSPSPWGAADDEADEFDYEDPYAADDEDSGDQPASRTAY